MLDQWNLRDDGNGFADASDLELKVQEDRSSHLHNETREHRRTEPCRLNFDAIRTNRQKGELIFAGGDRDGAALRAGVLRPHRDGRAANDRTRRVRDTPFNVAMDCACAEEASALSTAKTTASFHRGRTDALYAVDHMILRVRAHGRRGHHASCQRDSQRPKSRRRPTRTRVTVFCNLSLIP